HSQLIHLLLMSTSQVLASTTSQCFWFFIFTPPPTTALPPLSLHDALPISRSATPASVAACLVSATMRSTVSTACTVKPRCANARSEEHTSELQSRFDLVCRLLLEKKKKNKKKYTLVMLGF